MVLVNRRRRPSELPTLPSLTVEITRAPDHGRPIHAVVDKLTADTVIVTCASGVDALAVATSAELALTFRGAGVEVSMKGRPGKRVDDVHGHRSVELVLEHADKDVRLLG